MMIFGTVLNILTPVLVCLLLTSLIYILVGPLGSFLIKLAKYYDVCIEAEKAALAAEESLTEETNETEA